MKTLSITTRIVNPQANRQVKPVVKKNLFISNLPKPEQPEEIVRQANNFLNKLETLRNEIIARDEAYKAAKHSGESNQMAHYHQLAKAISQKCLDFGRELCDQPIPTWVAGNLSKENQVMTKHAYEVIRNKMCTSLDVFESDLLPNAQLLIDFAEGRF